MSTLAVGLHPQALNIKCTEASLIVELNDGRTISAPLIWFPRLAKPKGLDVKHNKEKCYQLSGKEVRVHDACRVLHYVQHSSAQSQQQIIRLSQNHCRNILS